MCPPPLLKIRKCKSNNGNDNKKAMEYAWNVIGKNTPAVRAWLEKDQCHNGRLGLAECDKGDIGDMLFAHIFCRWGVACAEKRQSS